MSKQDERQRLKTEACEILIRVGALKFGTFTLAGGTVSPYYVDLRIISSFPDDFKKVVNIYRILAKKDIGLKSFDRIAGIPTAGIPFASVLAYSLSKPFLYIRKEEKAHGSKKRVEGTLSPGERVLLVDDLVTSGVNITSSSEAVISEGGLVNDALVLIDREEGGKVALAKRGIELHNLLRMTEVAEILYAMKVISSDKLRDILKQAGKQYS